MTETAWCGHGWAAEQRTHDGLQEIVSAIGLGLYGGPEDDAVRIHAHLACGHESIVITTQTRLSMMPRIRVGESR